MLPQEATSKAKPSKITTPNERVRKKVRKKGYRIERQGLWHSSDSKENIEREQDFYWRISLHGLITN